MSTQNPVLPNVVARAVWQRDKPLLKSEATRPNLHPGEPAQNVERMRSFSELVSPRLDLGDDIIGMRDLQSRRAAVRNRTDPQRGRRSAAYTQNA